MAKVSTHSAVTVKIYHGYGHKENLIVYGHIFAGKHPIRKKYKNNSLSNIIYLFKLFFIKPVPGVRVMLQWHNQQLYSTTQKDGFFKFEWQSAAPISAGWHAITVHIVNEQGRKTTSGEGKLFVPHSTQYAFISDIDDTILISHSASTGKKLKLLFTRNPRSRKTFADVVNHYQLLSLANTEPAVLNPFFYVSSSEWNLYDDMNEFFKHNELPKGVFLLNELKKWYQLFKTGKTKHHGKLMRIARILDAFPKQRFVLLGDNTQSDPEIYASIADKYPEKIAAIYIRNIYIKKELLTKDLMSSIKNKQIHICIFRNNNEAIMHSKAIGLID